MKRIIKNILKGRHKKNFSDKLFISPNAKLKKSSSAIIENSLIRLENNAQLVIGDNVKLKNYSIHIINGTCTIESDTQLIGLSNVLKSSLYIEDGYLNIADHCIIKADFSIRYGGKCKIGSYTGIMDDTEIRCDESVSIGSYNMISYECMIYDTNTHCQYSVQERREMTRLSFPNIGTEKEKPNTDPVIIGDDCWLGKRSVVLKGVAIGNNCTVATCAVVTKSSESDSLIFGNPSISKFKKK